MATTTITIGGGRCTVRTGDMETCFSLDREKWPHAAAEQIATLHEAVQRLRTDSLLTEQRLLERMSGAAVNCGPHYGCSLAARMLADNK